MLAKGVSAFDVFTVDRQEEYRYVDVEGGIKVVGYSGLREYIEIPEIIDGKTVVAIGLNEDGYPGTMGFSILVPNTVRYIDPKSNPLSWGTWYKELYFKPDNQYFMVENDTLYSKDRKTLYFCYKRELDNLEISDEVENIGSYAFLKQRFKTIKLPKNLKSIGEHAFPDDYNTLELPDSVEKIGALVARKYSVSEKNKFFRIENDCIFSADGKILVQYVGNNISQLTVPDTVEEIMPYAFSSSKIGKLDLGAGVKKIGEHAFWEAVVKTIRIPAQLTELSESAFGYKKCNSIRVDKDNIAYFSDGVCFFSINQKGDKRLLKCFKNKETEYIVPEGTVSIAPGAFVDCSVLKNITLPESLCSFNDKCLATGGYNETSCAVSKVDIPANVSELDVSFEKYNYSIVEDNKCYFIDDNILYHEVDGGLEIVAAKNIKGDLTLRDDVVSVKAYAFSGCKKISKLTCNSALRIIGHNAFSNGFDNCGIKEIIFNEGLEIVDYLAFAGCKAKKVYIPASVKYMCISAFHNCDSLEYDVDQENEFYSSENGTLYNKNRTELRYVPKDKKIEKFEIPSTVIEIGRAFRNCKKVNEIVIPENVTSIWRDSLDCSAKNIVINGDIKSFNYTGISLWNGVKIHANAGTGAVQYVEWLKGMRNDVKVTLAINGLEDVSALTDEYDVVLNDSGLTILKVLKEKKKLVIPEKIGSHSITQIGAGAFEGNYSDSNIMEEIVFPDTVVEIGERTFRYRAKNFKKAKLPSGIKKIPDAMFCSCEGIEEVVIPDGVLEVGAAAFFGCENIKRIVFPKSITKISDSFMSDETGNYKDLYLKPFTVFVVEKGSYAEQFLKNYKSDNNSVATLNIMYSGMEDPDVGGTVGIFGFDPIDDNTAKTYFLSGYNYNDEKVVTPSVFSGRNVTVLNINRNYIGKTVKELTLTKTIEKVEYGKYAFAEGMKKLIVDSENKVYSTDGVSLLDKKGEVLYRVFCFGIKKYVVPNGVKIIEEEAFADCKNLEEIVLPESIIEIRKNAFDSCSNLKVISGLENVKRTGENAISGTSYAQNLDIIITGATFVKYRKTEEKMYDVPSGIEEIGNSAFYQYKSENMLEEVRLPNTLRVINNDAFSELKHLKEISIPEGVTEICDGAFSGCESLKEIHLPNSLKKIGNRVFEGCYSLKNIKIPSNVSEIGTLAFPYHKPEEKSSWRGDSPEIVAAFEGPVLSAENKNFVCKDGVLYSGDGTELIYVPDNYPAKEFIIPSSVKAIKTRALYLNRNIEHIVFEGVIERFEDNCFSKCEKLNRVDFSHEQKAIEPIILNKQKFNTSGVFVGCKNLNVVNLPDALEKIGDSAFFECSGLTSITIPDSVTEIGECAFYNCAITKIELPVSLRVIGNSAFEKNNITEVVLPKTLTSIGRNIFAGALNKVTLFDSIEPSVDQHLFPRFATDGENWPSFIPAIALPDFNIGSRAHDKARWDSFEVDVLSADTGNIKYKVYMPSNFNWGEFTKYVHAWGTHATFDFGVIDDNFGTLKENKLLYAVQRLRHSEGLNESLKETMVKYLNRYAKDFVRGRIGDDNLEDIEFCEQFGVIKQSNVDELIKFAHDKKNDRIEEHLKDYKADVLKVGRKPKSKAEDEQIEDNSIVIPGYHKADPNIFSINSAMNMDTSVYYCEFRFRGLEKEVEKLSSYLIENGLSNYEESEIGGGISEVRVYADETTPVLVTEFPSLKATGLCEDWGLSQVKVLYSESGYSVFTQCRVGGYFDPRHDGGDGRWELEYDMMEKVNVSFEWLQTGGKQRVRYSYPFKKEWDDKNYTIEVDGDIYVNDVVPVEEKKAKKSAASQKASGSNTGNDLLSGKIFVVTGKLGVFSNRDEMKEKIESLGGKLAGSISSKTTALVTNTPDSGTSKNIKAQELGVDIITEQEFIDKYIK